MCRQVHKIVCPVCSQELPLPEGQSPEVFVESLTTNYQAKQNQAIPETQEILMPSLLIQKETDREAAKRNLHQSLLVSTASTTSPGWYVLCDFLKYLVFTLPFFMGLFAYLVFVQHLYDYRQLSLLPRLYGAILGIVQTNIFCGTVWP